MKLSKCQFLNKQGEWQDYEPEWYARTEKLMAQKYDSSERERVVSWFIDLMNGHELKQL